MSRHGNKWTVNEVLSLQREYELLEMTVQQIADKHKRSVLSIVYKLLAEGFTSSLEEARGFTNQPLKVVAASSRKTAMRVIEDEDEDEDVESDTDTSSDFEDDNDSDSDSDDDDDDDVVLYSKKSPKIEQEMSEDDVSEVDKLTERVWSLETSVGEIGTMVKSLFDKLVSTNNSKKLQPLRKRSL
jgi:hypothetical protein